MWTAAAAAFVVVHLLVVYWPSVTVQGPVRWTDKVVHVLVFAVPTYAAGRALGPSPRSRAAVVAVFLAHAPLSELVQQFALPDRSGDPWDAFFDVVGVLVARTVLVVRDRRNR